MTDDLRPDTLECHAHQPRSFRRRRRRAAERLIPETAFPLVTVLAGAVIVGSGPLDYRFSSWLAAIAATIVAVFTVPLFVLRLALGSRVPVVLTPDAIDSALPRPGRIPWADVASLRTVSRLADRHVLLTRRDGTAVRLYAPRGSGWLPDPAFDREICEFRRYAARYGAEFEPDREDRRRPAAVLALTVLALLVTSGVRAADRGVIWPSTPTASQVTAACPALQTAGLDRVWPADTRTLDRDDLERHVLGESSYCGWVRRLDRSQDAPYMRIAAVVRRHDTFALSSPVAMATRSFNSERDTESSPLPAQALGDEAFMTLADDEVLVSARQANVTVSITFYMDVTRNPRDPQQVATTARALTTAILAAVRLKGPGKP
jgi:hypothetical protein